MSHIIGTYTQTCRWIFQSYSLNVLYRFILYKTTQDISGITYWKTPVTQGSKGELPDWITGNFQVLKNMARYQIHDICLDIHNLYPCNSQHEHMYNIISE